MEKLMTLFNKDHPVLKAIYDDEFHRFTKITEFTDLRYAPPAIINNRKTPERSALNDWWASRAVPASRQHLNQDFPYLNDVLSLPEKNMGLSLSDRYWVSNDPENDKWEDINFFDHPFSEDLGLVTLGQKQQSPEPGITSNRYDPDRDFAPRNKGIDKREFYGTSGVGKA